VPTPRLVHLNGPPGIGKSTIARRYIADHPLSFCLDIDGIRRLIGGWDSHGQESGRLARRMALRMMQEHLRAGHDVVVPQYVARPEFVHEMRTVAHEAGAAFYEIVLTDSARAARARFEARASDPAWAEHHAEAEQQIGKAGGFDDMYDSLMRVVDQLPDVTVISTSTDRIDDAYASVLAAVG
jgi:predicted kinase